MQTGHKHKELIKAWADGATIQFYQGEYWTNCLETGPEWDIDIEYRVKPGSKPDYSKFIGLYSSVDGDGSHHTSGVYIRSVPQEIESRSGMWNICNKLELVFDGETKELKEVKICGKN